LRRVNERKQNETKTGKRSAYGRLGGKNTIMEMTDLKTIVIDLENVRK